MAKNFHEHFEQQPPPMPSPRSTGLVFAAVALIVAVVWRTQLEVAGTALASSAAFATLAWLAPGRLEPLNTAWFRFALLLNRIVSPVVMLVLFAIVIVPAGLIMQRRYDPLLARRRAGRSTYWISRGEQSRTTDMRNQF